MKVRRIRASAPNLDPAISKASMERQHQQSCSMNGFERHGITRLSPSTLNHFAAEPAHWVMQRLLHVRAPMSAAAARGTAV